MDVEVEEDCLEWKYFEKFEEAIGQNLGPTAQNGWFGIKNQNSQVQLIWYFAIETLLIYDWKPVKK